MIQYTLTIYYYIVVISAKESGIDTAQFHWIALWSDIRGYWLYIGWFEIFLLDHESWWRKNFAKICFLLHCLVLAVQKNFSSFANTLNWS